MLISTKKHLTLLGALSAFAALAVAAAAQAAPIGRFTTKGAFHFVSAPGLHPPKLLTAMKSKTSQLAPGFFLLGNFKNVAENAPMVGQPGPLIMDNHLQPVWFLPIGTHALAANLRTQTYNGQPALSWWQGTITKTGDPLSGKVVVVDQHYHKIGSVTGKGGWIISLHDALVVGTDILVTAYRTEHQNLRKYHGMRNGRLLDCAVQTYDLKSGALKSAWECDKLVPLSQSYSQPASHLIKGQNVPWDAYHLNSIAPVGTNQFLISMRNTWAAYLVDGSTGKIVWTLGGKKSTFKIAKAAKFEWQHDVEVHPGDIVSVFDDACCNVSASGDFGKPSGPARGLVLKLDMASHTASLVSQYKRGNKFYVAFLGNTDLEPNGNAVVGWGSQPFFSEFSRSGRRLLDARWPSPDQSYRAFKELWVGEPTTKPSGAVRKMKGKTTVYASWNGATEVQKWRVLAGSSAGSMRPVATKGRNGFETAIRVSGSPKLFEVQALDAKGKVLGTSNTFPHAHAGPGFY